ncbi:MAG: thioredoxin family protein [Rhizobacter sp.]|nr:thioredoxin family protein [Ferruginibacter sp.]
MKRIFLSILIAQLSIIASAQNGQPADMLLDSALAKAKKENKSVFIISTASWCPPCNELKKILHDKEIQPLMDKHYVFLYLYTAERGKKMKNNNPGALYIIEKYEGYTSGVPYWFVVNAAGEKLADSYNGGEVTEAMLKKFITYRDSEEKVKDFTGILEKTSRLTGNEIKLISGRIKTLVGL